MKKRDHNCPYFNKKGVVNAHQLVDLFFGSTSKGPFLGEFTAILLSDAKNDDFRGIQRIYPETSNKIFRKGLNPSGAIFKVGQFINGKPIYILEAAADTLLSYMLTGHCSVAAMFADNIPLVAAIISKRFPDSPLVFVADNDQYGGANKGVDVCEESLRSTDNDAFLIIPEFEESEKKLFYKDLTDYCAAYGEIKTKALLEFN